MRPNVKQFVQLLSEAMALPRPIVDIGALRTEGQEDYADLRPYFAPGGYTGWDMRRGPGVDVVASVHHLALADASAGTVLMLDTLEHVLDPIASMHEVCRAVRPGGVAVISSHMNFPVHAHPSDYWRFTPMAFDYLMRSLDVRFVYMQGDAENPHNVMAAGMKTCGEPAAEERFRAAVRDVQIRWADDAYGGPLVACDPVTIDVSQRASDVDLPELLLGHRIEQDFVCASAGLSRIDVKMANRAGGVLSHVVFRLRDAVRPEREIAAQRVLGWHVVDDGWLAVPVPEQRDSAGRRYVLSIESPDATPGQAVSAKASAARAYDGGELTIDGEPADGSLCFQVYCRAPRYAAADVQVGEETLVRGEPAAAGPVPHGADLEAMLAVMSEQQWEQTRYLASTITAGFDALREQIRAGHAQMLDLQRQTLHASAEKLLARTVRENPASRALRRLRGGQERKP